MDCRANPGGDEECAGVSAGAPRWTHVLSERQQRAAFLDVLGISGRLNLCSPEPPSVRE
jgi:hypothetical protein